MSENKIAVTTSILCALFTALVGGYTAILTASIEKEKNEIQSKLSEVENFVKVRSEMRNDFTFVHSLLPDLLSKDPARQAVAIHLVRLALNTAEADAFIRDLSHSSEPALKTAGQAALKDISASRNLASDAEEAEQKGFDLLIHGQIEKAADQFRQADQIYNGYDNAYEIWRILKRKPSKNAAISAILESNRYGISRSTIDKLNKELGL